MRDANDLSAWRADPELAGIDWEAVRRRVVQQDEPEGQVVTYDAEEAVLGGAILLGSEPWPVELETLSSLDFSKPGHAAIWDAICEIRDAQQPVDEVTVIAKLREYAGSEGAMSVTPAQVARLTWRCPTTANTGHWAGMVGATGRKRRLRGQLIEIASSGLSAERMASEIANAQRLAEMSHDRGGPVSISRVAVEAMVALSDNRPPLCSTGLAALDSRLRLEAGELTLIAGRPSMGKTALALNVADHCADPRDDLGCTVFFSLEMSRQALVLRMMKRGARSTHGDLRAAVGSGLGPALVGRVERLRLHIDDRGGLNIDQMRGALRRMGRIRLVIVDYLQLAKLNEKHRDRRDLALGDLTKGLKGIAKEFGCHSIALSQLNRSVEKRSPPRPMLSDLRDSGNLEEDADNVVAPYRPEYYGLGNEGEAEMLVLKQRNGPTFSAWVAWVKDRQSFENLER